MEDEERSLSLSLSLSLLPPIASEPVEGEERGKKGKRRKKVEEREERSYSRTRVGTREKKQRGHVFHNVQSVK